MNNSKRHLILSNQNITDALEQLNELAIDAILFVVDEQNRLIGSLTDGDVRRGILSGKQLTDSVAEFIQPNPKYIRKGDYSLSEIIEYRNKNLRILPVLDSEDRVITIVNFRHLRSYLPLDAVIMAGGRGERLKPLTDNKPKPLLPVGEKPIIEHNVDRLIAYGIDDFWISLKYLGNQIESYFKDGSSKGVSIRYTWENEALGTIGALGKIFSFKNNHVLVLNSDLLTNLNYEDFFLDFLEKEADFSVLSIPYKVDVPYAILETDQHRVVDFKEKPSYNYFANGGIYLLKKELVDYIPKDAFYDATDLMKDLIMRGKKVISYPLRGYWLDIGNPADYQKAQEDINHIVF